jgi:hypothetical protein
MKRIQQGGRSADDAASERPGMKLTPVQASRFCSLGVAESEMLLDTLSSLGVVSRTSDGQYILFARSTLA